MPTRSALSASASASLRWPQDQNFEAVDELEAWRHAADEVVNFARIARQNACGRRSAQTLAPFILLAC